MKKRIFIAVDISEEVRRKAAAYIEQMRGEFKDLRVGWERAEKLHLTLKFLGETDESLLGKLNEIAESAAGRIEKFDLQIAETGVFPSPRNARVLWIDVKDEKGSLAQINGFLETECEKIGFAREKRDFVPHLTIARIREPQKSKELAAKHLQNKFEPVEFEVGEIVIYESRLQPADSIYKKISSFKLKA